MLAATLAGTVVWAWILLARSAEYYPWLKWLVLVVGLAVAVGLLVADRIGRAVAALAVCGVLAALGAPAAYALDTAGTPHTGSIPSAGPAVTGGGVFGAAGGPARFARRGGLPPFTAGLRPANGAPRAANGVPGSAVPGLPRAAPNGTGTGGAAGRPFGGGAGIGGLLDAAEVDEQVSAALAQDASSYTWVAAAVGSNRAAGYQLATELPVMPIGGFNGSDPSPTLAQFQQYVSDGQIHWFIAGGIGMRS